MDNLEEFLRKFRKVQWESRTEKIMDNLEGQNR